MLVIPVTDKAVCCSLLLGSEIVSRWKRSC